MNTELLPRVTVVIPCRNEQEYIIGCLNSVINCGYPKELLQIIVCDGISTDETTQRIKAYQENFPCVELVLNEKQTTQYALNLGVEKSSGDVVIILGAHAELYPDYISNCVKVLMEDNSVGCVGGILENVHENKTSEIIGAAMSSPFGVGNAHFRTGTKDGYVDTVAFGAYRKEVFEKIGLFDSDLIRNQDDEFNYRVLAGGYKIFLSRTIRAKYYVRASFGKLFKQYYQYGYWKVFVNRKHQTITTIRQLIPSFFVGFLIGGSIMVFICNAILSIYMSIIGFYFLVGIIMAYRQSGISKLPGVLLTFFILHLSYGWGYLEGIMAFFVLRKTPKAASAQLSR